MVRKVVWRTLVSAGLLTGLMLILALTPAPRLPAADSSAADSPAAAAEPKPRAAAACGGVLPAAQVSVPKLKAAASAAEYTTRLDANGDLLVSWAALSVLVRLDAKNAMIRFWAVQRTGQNAGERDCLAFVNRWNQSKKLCRASYDAANKLLELDYYQLYSAGLEVDNFTEALEWTFTFLGAFLREATTAGLI